jgi:hypothetical protein
MKLLAVQTHLKATGRYSGGLDGDYGLLSEAAILLALTDGPDTAVTLGDMSLVAAHIGVQTATIRAFWKIEAAGAGFQNGKPKILPEPHRFSRNTAHAFDASNPDLSYPKWGTRPYPAKQDDRYRVLLDWCRLLAVKGLDLDPAFASVSYGAPQIMGENAALCGYPDPFSFAEAMARDEKTQLDAFVAFVDHAGILPYLRKVGRAVESWQPIAKRYNGTAFAANQYDQKLAAAFAAFGGR